MTRKWAVGSGVCALLAALPLWAQIYGPSTRGPAGANVIPEGTSFIVRLDDKLDTRKLQQGKHFKAKLAEDLVAPDGATIPRGKKIKGHVSEVGQGFHGRLLLSFDEIETNHGWMPLVATVVDVPGEHGVRQTGSEGEIERRGGGNKRIAEGAVIGAGVGAAAGATAGGGRGAAIGAAAGGALGGAAGLLTDRTLVLDKGQNLELRLDRPLQVPWR